MRAWSIRITMLDEQGKDIPASIFEKATYRLHPSFEKPTQGMFFLLLFQSLFGRWFSFVVYLNGWGSVWTGQDSFTCCL